MLGDQVAHPTAPFLGKLRGVGGGEQGAARLPRQNVRREQHRPIGRFGRARRHEHRQPFDLAAIDPFKAVDQQAMMGGRLVTAMPAPFGQAAPDAPPPQQIPAATAGELPANSASGDAAPDSDSHVVGQDLSSVRHP